MKSMYEYICESDKAVRNIINNRLAIYKALKDRPNIKKMKSVFLAGSGTSYHASLASACACENILHVPARAVMAMEFVDSVNVIPADSLVIGISQGGRSTSTMNALRKGRDHGCVTIAITSDLHSPVASLADITIELMVGEEDMGPKTKGYFCSVATIIVLSEAIALLKGEPAISEETLYHELLSCADVIPPIAVKAKAFYEQNRQIFLQSRKIFVVGYMSSVASAYEGALKILETVNCPVQGFEMEEFMHGIYHAVDENTLIIWLGADQYHYRRMLGLLHYLQQHKHCSSVLITSDQSADVMPVMQFPFVKDNLFEGLEYIVPVQVIAEQMASDRGIDLTVSTDPDFHREMGSYCYEK